MLNWRAACAMAGVVLGLAAAPARAETVRAVLEAEIVTLDPHYTGAYISRTFGYMVFDTLFSPDHTGAMKPQMVDTTTTSPDGLVWTFTLRDGLAFHDGSPVTAEDVVASIKRWSTRNALGGRLMAITTSLTATDAKTFVLTLKEPYGLVIDTLGTASSPGPFIMPARLAATPGSTQITEIIGSGPFIYSRADHRPGVTQECARAGDDQRVFCFLNDRGGLLDASRIWRDALRTFFRGNGDPFPPGHDVRRYFEKRPAWPAVTQSCESLGNGRRD